MIYFTYGEWRRGRVVKQINFQWCVTKFNPDFRDENGYYTIAEEWTCPSEIGEFINGKEFTFHEYLQVETAYINSMIKFMEESNIDSLRILQLDKKISEEDLTSPLYEQEFEKLVLKEDLLVNKNELRLICKMILRNFIWCKLYSKDQFFIHFGWDYYMYIGSNVSCQSAIRFAESNGLFVEPCTSPYFFSEEETTRMIQWNEISDEDKIVIGEEELVSIPLDDYRRIFNLSAEHPVTGYFKIEKEQMGFFQTFLKHRMNFCKYEYCFCGEK